MYAGLQLITPPGSEPLSLTDAEAFLKLESDSGGPVDTLVNALITTARQQCETIMRRALLTQTWKLSLQNFPGRNYQNWPSAQQVTELDLYYKFNHVKLPFPPLQSVTSVNYMDSGGVIHMMVNAAFSGTADITKSYNVQPDFEPGRIVLPYAGIWPTDVLMPGAPVEITYVAGFADLEALQAWDGFNSVIQAMKMIITFFYENRLTPLEFRHSAVPAGIKYIVEAILEPYRIFDEAA